MIGEEPSFASQASQCQIKLRGYVASMMTWLGELADMKIDSHPNYTTKGVEAVFNALVHAREYGERAAFLCLQAGIVRTSAESWFTTVHNRYQLLYDRAVVETPRGKLEGLSWEDQASHHRMKLLDESVIHRDCEKLMEQIRAMGKLFDDRRWVITNARQDLQATVETMKFAHMLGELGGLQE